MMNGNPRNLSAEDRGPDAAPVVYGTATRVRSGALALHASGVGRLLVLIHGGTGSRTHWTANIPELGRVFRVLAVDLPGYGDAETAEGLTPDLYLEKVTADLGAAVPDRFDLVGFSFGAVVAAAVAASIGDRVRRLSLLGPAGFGRPEGRELRNVRLSDVEADPEGYRRAVAINLGEFMLKRLPEPGEPVIDIQIANIRNSRFDSRNISWQNRLLDDIAALRCPLQLIWGGEDRLAVPSVGARAELCRKVCPDAAISIVPGAGHWVQYERAGPVNKLLADFHNG
jgi:pimeloyl-ACP methyl ester carboxylesterase